MDAAVFFSFLLWYGTLMREHATTYLSFLLLIDIWVASSFFFFFFLTISNDSLMNIFTHICVTVSPGKYLGIKLLACKLDDDLIFSKETELIYIPMSS